MKKLVIDAELLLKIGIILIAAFILSELVRRLLAGYIRRNSKKMNVNPGNYSILKSIASFIIFSLALIAILHYVPGLEKLGTTLLASAGILSVILGLAAQQTFGNFISGLFMIVYKPFRVGDFVQLQDGNSGTVEDITLRHTIIRNPENRRLIIPNTSISNQTIVNSNLIDDLICNLIDFSIDYQSDIAKAIECIEKAAAAHPDFYDARPVEAVRAGDPAVRVRVVELGDYAIKLRAAVWCKEASKAYAMKCDLLYTIKLRFDESGINIPFPRTDVQIIK